MRNQRVGNPTTVEIVPSDDWRVDVALQFVSGFAAYTVDGQWPDFDLWYRDRHGDPRALHIQATASGVIISGEQEVRERVLNAAAPPLPSPAAVAHWPEPHRALYYRYRGVRPVLFPNSFEGLAWAIIAQQITTAWAIQLKGRVAARFGHQVVGRYGPLAVFPRPEIIAELSMDALTALQLSRQKAATLIRVARAFAEARIPDDLAQWPLDEAERALTTFSGIGPWTAHYALARVFGHPDAFPAGDAGLQRAWARWTGSPASPAVLRDAAEVWRGVRGDFAFRLWVDNRRDSLAPVIGTGQ